MSSSRTPKTGNVVPLRAQRPPGDASRAQAAMFICQMTLELEQLANTAGLELVSYFLALARNEASPHAGPHASQPLPADAPNNPQAPYLID